MKITEPVVVHCPLTRPRAGVSCVLERVRRPASLPGIDMDRCVLFASVGVRSVSSTDMYNNDVGKESAQKFMKQTGDLKAATLYFAS